MSPRGFHNRVVTEKEFQSQVITLARACGWMHYHTYDSRRSVSGFPDLVLVRAPRLLIRECKTDTGKVTPTQGEWINVLRQCGVDAAVWRPSDWPEIEATLARERRAA